MKRLIFSAAGIILTFLWIIYTAPPVRDKNEIISKGHIKTIIKTGSSAVNKIKNPLIENLDFDKLKKTKNLVTKPESIISIKSWNNKE